MAQRTQACPAPDPGIEDRPELERYELGELLGEGGMGLVWRARDRPLGRSVALKVMRGSLAPDETLRGRFTAEAQATAQLTHPGIVPVYDLGTDEHGRPWYAMQEISGRGFDLLLAAPQTTLRERVEVLAKVAETMAYAHARGVIHRDLKPENVMVGTFSEVLVLDWGLARVGEPSDDTGPRIDTHRTRHRSSTRRGLVSGTPAWMAPEQAMGEVGDHGPWSDVFALGGTGTPAAPMVASIPSACPR